MENSSTVIGTKGLIRRHEFVRIIIQSLYLLGYRESAACLESESKVLYKSKEFELLESQILEGNWEGCVNSLNAIKDLEDDTRASPLFVVFKQCLLEHLNCGDDTAALTVLRKQVAELQVGMENVRKLSYNILYLEDLELGKADDNAIHQMRIKLLSELEKLLPPPIVLPEKRLEHLVEMAITAQIDSCLYHNSEEAVSLYEDHCCTRDQIPTQTLQAQQQVKEEDSNEDESSDDESEQDQPAPTTQAPPPLLSDYYMSRVEMQGYFERLMLGQTALRDQLTSMQSQFGNALTAVQLSQQDLETRVDELLSYHRPPPPPEE